MSGVVRGSMDVALEVLADGFTCDGAIAEWMGRLQALGLRYCPLAQEQLLLSCIDEDEEEPEVELPAAPEIGGVEGLVEGSLIIPQLEEEPVARQPLEEQGKLPPPPPPAIAERTPGVADQYFIRYSYTEPVLPDGSGGRFQRGETEIQTFAAIDYRYSIFPAQSNAPTLAVWVEAVTSKVIASKTVSP
jgi:hypothetical protein